MVASHPLEKNIPLDILEDAKKWGVDVSLILNNLVLTPTERIAQHDAMVADLLHFQKAIKEKRRQLSGE